MKPTLLYKNSLAVAATVLAFLLAATAAFSQSSSFTYQGRLTDSGTPANGNYDLQFGLWDSLSGGTQIGSTQTLNTVLVSNGIFTVSLDFGTNSFSGASRFLEINARPTGGAFVLLTPRQPITSTPYAIRSANASSADTATNATQLGGIASGQYVQTNDSRLTDSRTPTPGSASYVQNTTGQQSSTNFNVSGNGTANVLNATTQFNLNGIRVLSTLSGPSGGTLSVGLSAGPSSQGSGDGNAFFGNLAGHNSQANISSDSFFGAEAGQNNTTGSANSFFGAFAGLSTTTSVGNSFFGRRAGINSTGSENTFFGDNAGQTDRTGSQNTLIGSFADVGANLTNATAIGACAEVTQSNSLILGANGFNQNCQQTFNTNVGIGTTAPVFKLHVVDNSNTGLRVQTNIGGGTVASFGGNGDFQIDAVNVAGGRLIVQQGGNVGIGTASPDSKLTVNGTADKPGGGSWGTFSDERLKNIKGRFTSGLKSVMQLQPIRYQYKPDNVLGLNSDGEYIGFGAQAVQKIIPEAVSKNDKGYLLVNNDPILWTMLNAIKEQQKEIEELKGQIVRSRAVSHRRVEGPRHQRRTSARRAGRSL